MFTASLSDDKYREGIHLVFRLIIFGHVEKKKKKPRIFLPGLSLRDDVDMPRALPFHVLIFKPAPLERYTQFSLEDHLVGRTSCMLARPQFRVSSQPSYVGSHNLLNKQANKQTYRLKSLNERHTTYAQRDTC